VRCGNGWFAGGASLAPAMTAINPNAAAYFVDRHAAGGRGARTAFREAGPGGRSLTYSELIEGSARVADAFALAGVRREERAAMIMLDQIEFPLVFWGALKAGVVAVPVNTLLAGPVYDTILRDCRAACLFVSEALWPAVAPFIPDNPYLRQVVIIGTAQKHTIDFGTFLSRSVAAETLAVRSDETAFWLYSSGSTGQPKGVRHVHGALKATSDTYGAQVLSITEGDVVFSAAKLFFAYGLGNSMTFPMSVGATTVLYPGRPTPDSVTEVLRSQRPTIFNGVPTLYAALLNHWEKAGQHPAAPLRVCTSAGEALPAQIGKAWKARWGLDILDGVGSTEMLHIFLSNRADSVVYGTSGIAVPGYQLRLVNETGAATGPGEVGELLVRGASAADGYWNQRERSRTTFEGEWTRTGDKYEQSPDGRYIYCGRTDDMFKVSGIWVAPFEVEQAIISHPAVLEAAVVARRDEEGLEKPMAFVVLKSGQSVAEGELKEHVKAKIGLWKYPRWIEIVPELPKTATGKIQRFKLRETVA